MSRKVGIYLIIGFILFLALFNSLLSSSYPDGLERVAEDYEFASRDRESLSFFKDYQLPLKNSLLAEGLAGLLGVSVVYLLLTGLGRLIAGKKDG